MKRNKKPVFIHLRVCLYDDGNPVKLAENYVKKHFDHMCLAVTCQPYCNKWLDNRLYSFKVHAGAGQVLGRTFTQTGAARCMAVGQQVLQIHCKCFLIVHK